MRRALIGAAVAASALAAATAAGGARLATIPALPAGWSHAEINVTVRGVPHTLVLDRGRVRAVGPGSLTVRESDGSTVTVRVSRASRVTIDGRRATLSRIRRGLVATTLSIDGGPARIVRLRTPRALAARLPRALPAVPGGGS